MNNKSIAFEKPVVTYATLVGKVLQQFRKEKAIEQITVANDLGISQSAYSRLESGNSTLTVAQLRTAAASVGVQAHEILEQADQKGRALIEQGVTVVSEKPDNAAAAIIGLGILLALLSTKG